MQIHGIDPKPHAFVAWERQPQEKESKLPGGLTPVPKASEAEEGLPGGLVRIVTPPVEPPDATVDLARLRELVGQVYGDLKDLGALATPPLSDQHVDSEV